MVTNSFGNRNFMQPMEGAACTQTALFFFLLSFECVLGGGGGEDFFIIFPLFPTCSLQVTNGFLIYYLGSQCFPRDKHGLGYHLISKTLKNSRFVFIKELGTMGIYYIYIYIYIYQMPQCFFGLNL
jgi:hypothetical protein